MNRTKELLNLTQKMLEFIEFISVKYEEVKRDGTKGDFFNEVKPFADEVKEVNDLWKDQAIQWIKEARPKNLHERQIESAAEQMETISVQTFYSDTSRTRFINYLQSVKYVLTVLLDKLNS